MDDFLTSVLSNKLEVVSDKIPSASSTMPIPTALDSNPGTSGSYARADHTHAAKVQRAVITTDALGNATMTFARSFVNLPAVSALANTTGTPIALSITAKTINSVTINAKQSRTLPAVITLVGALVNYSIFSDPAVNIQIDVIAAEVTQ